MLSNGAVHGIFVYSKLVMRNRLVFLALRATFWNQKTGLRN